MPGSRKRSKYAGIGLLTVPVDRAAGTARSGQGHHLRTGQLAVRNMGLRVVKAQAEHEVHDIGAADPAIASGMCTYEVGTMPQAAVAV